MIRKEISSVSGEIVMRHLALCLTVCGFVLAAQGCATHRPDWDLQRQTSIASQKDEIVTRLIPEDGLTFTRRTRLIDATIAVLGKGDREELQNLGQLRSTLRAASLQNLEKIESNYKERLADGE
jgi:hypothetical protein